MNMRHICLYLAHRIGRWNNRRFTRTRSPILGHTIDRISLRLYEAANR